MAWFVDMNVVGLWLDVLILGISDFVDAEHG